MCPTKENVAHKVRRYKVIAVTSYAGVKGE